MALNDAWVAQDRKGRWVAVSVDDKGDGFGPWVGALSKHGPWAAHVHELGWRVGHFLVVDGVADYVAVLDPWHPGTSYRMTVAAFESIWNTEVVFLRERA
jgi:hypothetical protein